MQNITKIICPNCGNPAAERHHIASSQIRRTQCAECDYLLVMCLRTNRVIEAYAPGMDMGKSSRSMRLRALANRL
jgi:ribosomal protein S27AE